MTFPLEVLRESKNKEKLLEILKMNACDNCLGRQFGMIGHGMTNAERGGILRKYAEELIKSKLKEPEACSLCNSFFKDGMNKIIKVALTKIKGIEFDTFLVGSVVPSELGRRQEELWMKIGIEDVESIKSEMNREVGKRIEKLTKKKFDLKNPDVIILLDLSSNNVRLQIRSLYIYGKYQKLARGIPQTKWICPKCNGKGCTYCKGEGKLYPTSVHEIVEKPFDKASDCKNTAFHAAGREDIDARNLDWRPYVIELIKPMKRKLDLKEIGKQINKSKKVKVKGLKPISDGKEIIRKLKTEKMDKTYRAEVEFKNEIEKSKLKDLRKIAKEQIVQKTPTRVVHRRADKFRRRYVKSLIYKQLGQKKLQLKIRAEGGLYIKELVSGDEGRTMPNVADILGNKVKKIKLDVIKIHS